MKVEGTINLQKKTLPKNNNKKNKQKAISPLPCPAFKNSVNHFIIDWIPGLTMTVLGVNFKCGTQEKMERIERKQY